ncbi:MAG: hypothetical protein AAF226_06280 [Verrucomicrobiota bacterium]
MSGLADELPAPFPGLPVAVSDDRFESLKQNSPFQRVVEAGGSMVLTGYGKIDGETFATLFDAESKQSLLISGEPDPHDPNGWKLVEVKSGEPDVESTTAKIEMNGGELVNVRYGEVTSKMRRESSRAPDGATKLSPKQIDEAKRFATNYKGDFSADGFREPPKEVYDKLAKISVERREQIFRYMINLRNKGMGTEARKKVYVGLLDKAVSAGR